jgi:hypothetical protein
MTTSIDLWFLRLPDGRILRATSDVVRQQITAGRLSTTATARRPGETTWRPLLSFDEFSDLQVGGESVASRLDPTSLNFVRVRSLLEELLAALDSTFTTRKLAVLILSAFAFAGALVPAWMGWVPPLASAAVALGLMLVQMALLTRLTFLELSRLRPTGMEEALQGSLVLTVRLSVTVGLVAALALAARLIAGDWLASWGPDWLAMVAPPVAQGVGLLLAALAVYLTPLAAAMVIEDGSLRAGLESWRRLTRHRPLAVLVAQWLTLTLGVLLCTPLLALTWLLPALPVPLLLALAVPLVSGFLAIANVFLMLHFRYSD